MERNGIRWNGDAATNEAAWRWLAQAFAMPALLATPARDLSRITLPPARLAPDPFIALLGTSGVRQDDATRARHATGGRLADRLLLRAGELSTPPDAVLYPRNEEDVLAVLKLCTNLDVAVIPFGGGTGDVTPARGEHASVVSLNMSGLNRIVAVDTVSGLAEVEAGITGTELERELAAHSMSLGPRPGDFEIATLGGWIAQGGSDGLRALRVAMPHGLLTAAPQLTHLMSGSRGAFGVITRATIAIQPLPEKEAWQNYLFPDFAGSLAAMREVQRLQLPGVSLRLSDDGETRFSRVLQRNGSTFRDHLFDIYLAARRFDGHAAHLLAGFSGRDSQVAAARKAFDRLARRMGAIALGATPNEQERFAARREALLDRGAGLDRLEIMVRWSDLPLVYVKVRAALKQAMREWVPREGAHGLVLAEVGSARSDGAVLTLIWAYPRKLEDEITQADAIRRAALAALGGTGDELERDLRRAIKQTLDPKAILSPEKL